jgi:hypothetical protein
MCACWTNHTANAGDTTSASFDTHGNRDDDSYRDAEANHREYENRRANKNGQATHRDAFAKGLGDDAASLKRTDEL